MATSAQNFFISSLPINYITGTVDIYVSPVSGNNTNPGTLASPVQSFAGVSNIINNRALTANTIINIYLDAQSGTGNFGSSFFDCEGNGNINIDVYNGAFSAIPSGTFSGRFYNNNVSFRNISLAQISIQSGALIDVALCTGSGQWSALNCDEYRIANSNISSLRGDNTLTFTINNSTVSGINALNNLRRFQLTNTTLNGSLSASNCANVTISNSSIIGSCNITNTQQIVSLSGITWASTFANCVINGAFTTQINGTHTVGANKGTNTPALFSITNCVFVISGAGSTIDYSNRGNIKFLKLDNVMQANIGFNYTNLLTSNYTLTVAPIELINSSIRFTNPALFTGQTITNTSLFSLSGACVVHTIDESFNNLPYEYNSLGIPAGTIINFTDANEVKYDSATSGLPAAQVKDALDILATRVDKTLVFGTINGAVGSTAAQDLFNGSAPFIVSPHVIVADGKINQVILANSETNLYTIEVLINNTVVGTFSRTNNAITQVFDLITPIAVTKGDQLRLRFAGGSGVTTNPTAQLTYTT